MNASKEICRNVYGILNAEGRSEPGDRVSYSREQLTKVFEFLRAAERRLPTAAAIIRDQQRKKSAATKGE